MATLPNGDIYKGEYSNGKRNGQVYIGEHTYMYTEASLHLFRVHTSSSQGPYMLDTTAVMSKKGKEHFIIQMAQDMKVRDKAFAAG